MPSPHGAHRAAPRGRHNEHECATPILFMDPCAGVAARCSSDISTGPKLVNKLHGIVIDSSIFEMRDCRTKIPQYRKD